MNDQDRKDWDDPDAWGEEYDDDDAWGDDV